MPARSPRRSALALTILAILSEEPTHPYRMQQLIKTRAKDQVVNVRQRASIYQTIDRLLRDGLIAVRDTERDEKWPERTVYELTPEGRSACMRWLREMLSTPAREFPEFPAAVAHLVMLGSDGALPELQARAAALEHELADAERDFAKNSTFLLRVLLLEEEYRIAMLRAELSWVTSVADDLRAGRLTWTEPEMLELTARLEGQHPPAPRSPGPQRADRTPPMTRHQVARGGK